MQTLLFGTNNPHKLRELREILSGHYEVKSLADLGIDMEVEETEDTLQGNAFLKVDAYAKASGLPTFADDTGLAVDVLDGRPGVYAARYAGEGCKPEDNINKLLGEMEGETERSARFITVIA
ncbi:MAG: non-canonical purine NTP pyrophosphatase, partial [Bacteroidota bacterium]